MNSEDRDTCNKSRKQKAPKQNRKRARPRDDSSDDEENASTSFFSLGNTQPITFQGVRSTVHLYDSDDSDDDDDDDDGGGGGNQAARQGRGANNWQRNVDDDDSDADVESENGLLELSDDEEVAEPQNQQDDRSPSPQPAALSASYLARVRRELGGTQATSDLDRALSNLREAARRDVISPSPATPSNSSFCIDPDDSPTFMSPSERDIVVKVRTRHGVKRFTMKTAEQFQLIIKQLAEMENIDEDNILLSLRDTNIVSFDTPLSIKLTVADIIECVVMESKAADTSIEREENSLEIKVQGDDNASKKTFKVAKTDPLSGLMNEYCQFRKLPRSKITFLFDGDVLRGSETPEELDMEDENMIDVRVK